MMKHVFLMTQGRTSNGNALNATKYSLRILSLVITETKGGKIMKSKANYKKTKKVIKTRAEINLCMLKRAGQKLKKKGGKDGKI